MNLSKLAKLVEDLESRIGRSAHPGKQIAVAILLFGLLGILVLRQVTSRSQIQRRHAKASAQFGEALLKAGIPTQSGPSR